MKLITKQIKAIMVLMNININDKNDEFINDCYNSNGEINTS